VDGGYIKFAAQTSLFIRPAYCRHTRVASGRQFLLALRPLRTFTELRRYLRTLHRGFWVRPMNGSSSQAGIKAGTVKATASVRITFPKQIKRARSARWLRSKVEEWVAAQASEQGAD
jgi:predicted DNA-binding transcriptional regulator AlpA